MSKKVIKLLITLFGVFYMFSGIVKIIDIDNFLFLIRSYKMEQLLYFALLIPISEIILSLLLIFRIKIKYTLLSSIVLLLFFTVIFSVGHFLYGIDDCGCFGGIDFLKMSPAIFYIRNGALIALSFYLYNKTEDNDLNVNLPNLLVIITATTVSSIFIGQRSEIEKYIEKTPYTKTTINEYHNGFINKNIHNTILSKYIETSQDSTYLIFIFSYNCPHCLLSSIYLNDYVSNNTVDKVVGLTKGTRKEQRFYEENLNPTFEYNQLKFIDIHMITGFYPLSFYVKNDTIQFKVRGALPKHDEFGKLYLIGDSIITSE